MKNKKATFITQAAAIAAVYTILTLMSNALGGLATGLNPLGIQVRFSEALCILPMFMPAAIPGLFVGCIISNLLTGCMIPDIIFGSLATLIGAVLTRRFHKPTWLGFIWPILSNALIVPAILTQVYKFENSYFYYMATVGIGEIISVGLLGYAFFIMLKKYNLIERLQG